MKQNKNEENEKCPAEKKKRAGWDLWIIKWFKIILDYNLFKSGKHAESLY
ncbi:hypothetical protein JWG39_01845 [Desulforhopalus vacuolatus]|nr:hypothetical protein [Desulforhopalus vacuolatus]MBM9518557.1 hypothetical protein [Desulforhopalus vacuolatus]